MSVYEATEKRIARLDRATPDNILAGGRKGIEKEALRVTADGTLAMTPHPAGLGSALTNRYITTDYSEALLELVTPPTSTSWQTLQCLCDLHQFVYENLGQELLWATSMPCAVSGDEGVPIANYGTSNVGTMKHIYRRGLGARYGRVMQAISGVHFNYSFDPGVWPVLMEIDGASGAQRDFVSGAYFSLLRNFRRCGWLVLVLFGASPAVCKSFAPARTAGLDEFDAATWYGPYATTLRMSDIGYKNKVQAGLDIPVNSVDEYIAGLRAAISTPHPDYERIGVQVDGEYRQLNANVLQIENEFYSLIRPKRVAYSGEKATTALARGGVEYVEVRALDVGVFDPAGVSQAELRFVEMLLTLCLLQPSPPIAADEQREIDRNQLLAARQGRKPGLELFRHGKAVSLSVWALELCDQMEAIAALLDRGTGGTSYRDCLAQHRAMVADTSRTPSARILEEMRSSGESFFRFGMRMSMAHRDYFASLAKGSSGRRQQLGEETIRSLAEQAEIEKSDSMTFAEYLDHYFAGTLEHTPRVLADDTT